jgi:Ca2+-binding EF-hand superfamily protein
MRDQLPSDFIYQEMFAAFDIDGSGAIEKEDLETSAKSMGWSNQQGKFSHISLILKSFFLI